MTIANPLTQIMNMTSSTASIICVLLSASALSGCACSVFSQDAWTVSPKCAKQWEQERNKIDEKNRQAQPAVKLSP
jgi:hypothetical protein